MEEIIINQFLQSFSTPTLNQFFQIITYLGHPSFWIIIAAWFYWTNKKNKGIFLIGVIVVASGISGVLKILIARPRPEGILILDHEATYSMPSGHSTLIASGTTYLWNVTHIIQKYWLILIAILVGISRMYLGAHYFSDVLVGLILGLIIGVVAIKVEEVLYSIKIKSTPLSENIALGILTIMTIIALIKINGEYLIVLAFLTFFIGHFLNNKLKIKETKTKHPLNFIGAIILGVLIYLGITSSTPISQIAYLLSGLFATLIWPLITSKLKL